MKFNNQIISSTILPTNSQEGLFGELTEPLNPIKPDTQAIPEPDLTLYSHRGFIKGVNLFKDVKKLKYGFSTRRFGNMAFRFGEPEEVLRNRKTFARAVGIDFKNTVFMRSTHGKTVEVVNSSHKGRGSFKAGTSIGPADALITFEKGVALGLNSADCVPLIMTTKRGEVLALVHAGRIGTDARVVKTTIRKMISFGIKAEDLMVGIGPAIQKSCYRLKYLETDKPYQWLPWIAPVLKGSKIMVEKNEGTDRAFKIRASKGKILVDIVGLNIAQLLEMGVRQENIDPAPVCALCMARQGEIFSHYLSTQIKTSSIFPEGRFMSIAQLG